MESTQDRVARAASWLLAVGALLLSLSGWFALMGLALAMPAIAFAKVTANRRPFVVAIVAFCVSVGWLVLDRVVA